MNSVNIYHLNHIWQSIWLWWYGGITSETMYFISLDDAKTAFEEVAHDHGYEPEEINKSDYYDVSIWEWAEDKYQKVYRD